MTTAAIPVLGGDLAACCSPIAGGVLDEAAAERSRGCSGRSATATGSGCCP